MSNSDHFLRWQVGFDTDIGGGRENQDDCFIWANAKERICVLCVLDGHGREVGKIAANAAKYSLLEYFEVNHKQLRNDPYNCLVKAHEHAHYAIKSSFKRELERIGYEVVEAPEGYLMKRRTGQQWSCVHGGSSCSICALVDGMLYIANVGDSSGTLCAIHPILNNKYVVPIGDAAVPLGSREKYAASVGSSAYSASSSPPTYSGVTNSQCSSISEKDESKSDMEIDISASGNGSATTSASKTNTLVVTAEHSPESPYEFIRLRKFRPRDGNPHHPMLNVVYDSPMQEKAQCPPVFSLHADGQPTVTNKGAYYKNVRKEWASLVSTPTSARFQDALAFTRSLGDLHLQTYGVTHLPEVQCVDLKKILSDIGGKVTSLERTKSDMTTGSGSTSGSGSTDSDGGKSPDIPMLCLVLATDGVWDNWTYEDVTRFVMDPSCVDAVVSGADGAHRVTASFMQRNALYSKRNFGSQADNATGIVMYVSSSVGFPTGPEFEK